MDFGERLRELREEKGLKQAVVAELIGVSRRTYVAYENEGKRPRYRETYYRLADVLDCDVNDLLTEDTGEASSSALLKSVTASQIAGLSVGALATTALAGSSFMWLPLAAASAPFLTEARKARTKAPSEPEAERPFTRMERNALELLRHHRRFIATAKGLIFSALAEQDIPFAPLPYPEEDTEVEPEAAISLEQGPISTWWLYFVEKQADSSKSQIDPTMRAASLLICIYDLKPNPSRKVSIVVDDNDLFEALKCKRGNNSYRGNLSVILLDSENVSLAEEVFISTYDDDGDETDLLPIAGEQ